MHYYHSISNKELNRQISLHQRLSTKSFSFDTYRKQEKLEAQIEHVITSFEDEQLHLDPSQYALFAQYIYAITTSEGLRNRLYDRLQKMADFDVRAEAKRANLTFFQKLFNIDPDAIPYLSKSKLKKRMAALRRIHHHFEASGFKSVSNYKKEEKLHHEAKRYMQAFIDGKITIKPEDRETFAKYVKVFEYPLYEESTGQQCLNKLKTLPEEYTEEKKTFKEKFNMWLGRFQAPKSKTNKPTVTSKPQVKTSRRNYIRAASVALVMAMGGALAYVGLNYKKHQKIIDLEEIKNDPEAKVTPKSPASKQQTSSASNAKVINWDEALKKTEFKSQPATAKETKKVAQITTKSQSQKEKPEQATVSKKVVTSAQTAKAESKTVTQTAKPVNTTSVVNTKELTPSEKKAIIEHHSFVVGMRLGKANAQKLNEQIESLRDKDNTILSLPEDISNAEVAYAFVMYRAYGVQSSLKDALNSKVKLTAAQNQQVLEDIMAVGSVGEGVKKLAEKAHKGELSHQSCYDNTTSKNKKQHVLNLKQLRQIQKAKQRVA